MSSSTYDSRSSTDDSRSSTDDSRSSTDDSRETTSFEEEEIKITVNHYIFVYEASYIETINAVKRDNPISKITAIGNYIHVKFSDKKGHLYNSRRILLKARSWAPLIKATIVFSDSSETVIHNTEELTFVNQTTPEPLTKDTLEIISSQLDLLSSSHLRAVSKSYFENMNPTKWEGKTKGISQSFFYNLRQLYTIGEIAELFMMFPDVVETCIDHGLSTTKMLGVFFLASGEGPSNGSKDDLLNYLIEMEAYDSALMVIDKVGPVFTELTFIDPELTSMLYKKHIAAPNTKPKSLVSKETQWNLLDTSGDVSATRKLIEVYGFDTFCLDGKNVLNNTFDCKIQSYLSTLEGIEEGYIIKISSVLRGEFSPKCLLNPLLYPEEKIVRLLRYSLLCVSYEQLNVVLACIACLRNYDLSSITEIGQEKFVIDSSNNVLNILRCSPSSKHIIEAIEDQYVQGKRTRYEQIYAKTKKDVYQDLTVLINTLVNKDEANNVLVERIKPEHDFNNFNIYVIIPLRIQDPIRDYISSKSSLNERINLIFFYLYSIESFIELLLATLKERFPLSADRIEAEQFSDKGIPHIKVILPLYISHRVAEIDLELHKDIYSEVIVLPQERLYKVKEKYNHLVKDDFKSLKNYLIEHGASNDVTITLSGTELRIFTNTNDKYEYSYSEKSIIDTLKLCYQSADDYNSDLDSEDYEYILLCYKGKGVDIEKLKSKVKKSINNTWIFAHGSYVYAITSLLHRSVEKLNKLMAGNELKKIKLNNLSLPRELQFVYIREEFENGASVRTFIRNVKASLKEFDSIKDVVSITNEFDTVTIMIPTFILEALEGKLDNIITKNKKPYVPSKHVKKESSSSSLEEVHFPSKKALKRPIKKTVKKYKGSSSTEEERPKKAVKRPIKKTVKKYKGSSSTEEERPKKAVKRPIKKKYNSSSEDSS